MITLANSLFIVLVLLTLAYIVVMAYQKYRKLTFKHRIQRQLKRVHQDFDIYS